MQKVRVVLDGVFLASALIFALLAITRRNPVYGILFLMGVGVSVAGIFAMSGAFFLALLQILIYVGAVLVLFIFVVSLLNLQPEELRFEERKVWRAPAFIAVIALGGMLILLTLSALPETHGGFLFFPAREVAISLLKQYMFQFEFLSVFLLAVIVATAYVGRRFPRR